MLPTKLLASVTPEQIATCDTGAECMALLHTLTELRKGIFLWLLEMMADVAARAAASRMNERAIAIVIAPNLYDPPPLQPGDDPMASLTYTQGMARFVTELLTHYIAVRGRVRERHASLRASVRAGSGGGQPGQQLPTGSLGPAVPPSPPTAASSSTTTRPPAESSATSAFC